MKISSVISAAVARLRRKGVARNILIVFLVTLMVKGLGFFKETFVAANFGLSEVLDTFFIAFILPGFIQNVFVSSFNQVFIPNYVAEQHGENNTASFKSAVFLVTFSISLFLVLVSFVFADVYIEEFFPGHDSEYYALVKSQLYFLLPCILFWGLSSLIHGLLNIRDEYLLSSSSGVILPITIILTLYFGKEFFGKNVLAIGTLFGAMLSFSYLVSVGLKKGVLAFSKPNFRSDNIRVMLKQVPVKMTSSFLTGMHNVIDSYFAAKLVIGSVSALNYGNKIPAFAIGILVIAISNVLLPYFSKAVVVNRKKSFETLFRLLKTVFIVSAIVAVLGIITSDFFVSLFFERGKFSSNDAEIVSLIQKIILIYVPFKTSGMLIVNFLTSINKNNIMALVAFISVVLNAILDYVLIGSYGVYGIAMASTAVIVLRNILMFSYTWNQYRLFNLKR